MLEWNLAEAEKTIESLQMDLDEQAKYSASQQVQLKNLENKYILSEKRLKTWKTISIVLIIICSIEGAFIIWQ